MIAQKRRETIMLLSIVAENKDKGNLKGRTRSKLLDWAYREESLCYTHARRERWMAGVPPPPRKRHMIVILGSKEAGRQLHGWVVVMGVRGCVLLAET